MRRAASTLAALLAGTVLAGCGAASSQQVAKPPSSTAAESAGATPTSSPSRGSTSDASPGSTVDAPAGESAQAPPKLRFNARTLDGGTFSGASLAGEPAVLWFWAPWCPNCRAEAPAVAEAARNNGDVTFVGVSSRAEASAMRDFVSRYGVGGFTQINDTTGEIWSRFGVTYQPAYAFISADGSIEVVKRNLSEESFRQRVARLSG